MGNRIIAITGFMAAGKTTVGQALAKRLGLSFVDLDNEIVKWDGRQISEIIETDGEAQFRNIETAVLKNILREPITCVIALGGGTWSVAENRKLLQDCDAYVVWLDAPFEVCWSRISVTDNSRPLAASRSVAEELYRERRAAYQLANGRIEIEQSLTATQCAEAISALLLQKEWH